jgi:hypothetical protein
MGSTQESRLAFVAEGEVGDARCLSVGRREVALWQVAHGNKASCALLDLCEPRRERDADELQRVAKRRLPVVEGPVAQGNGVAVFVGMRLEHRQRVGVPERKLEAGEVLAQEVEGSLRRDGVVPIDGCRRLRKPDLGLVSQRDLRPEGVCEETTRGGAEAHQAVAGGIRHDLKGQVPEHGLGDGA